MPFPRLDRNGRYRRLATVIACALAGACGGRDGAERSAPARAAAPHAGAAESPARAGAAESPARAGAASPSVATPAASDVPPCTLAGRELVASAGARPSIAVGRTSAIVGFEPERRRLTGSIRYDWAYQGRVLEIPVAAAHEPRTGVTGSRNDPGSEESAAYLVARWGEEPVALDCSKDVGEGNPFYCMVFSSDGRLASPDLVFPEGWSDLPATMAAASSGTTLFVAALAESRRALVVWVVRPDAPPVRAVVADRVDVGDEVSRTRLTVDAISPDEARVRVRLASGSELELAVDGRAVVTAPLAPSTRGAAPLAVRTEGEGGAVPHVTVSASGQSVANLGLDPRAPTFAPTLVPLARGDLLVWTEGRAPGTRVRAARLHPSTHAIIEPIVEVSALGREAGSADADAYAGHVVVVWDERDGGTREVHAAEVVCP